MSEPLLTPILTDGLRRLHFFNGRVLTAEDFQAEQTALRRRDERLGRALGEGVVGGLTVRLKTDIAPRTVVVVEPGLAVSRGGQVLELPLQQEVSIVPEGAAAALGAGAFVPCGPAATVTPAGFGAYVLVMAPVSGMEGSVPYVGLADGGVATSCARRYEVEGVQFRLLFLDVQSDALMPAALAGPIRDLAERAALTAAERSRLRNLLAAWCLGTAATPHPAADLPAVFGAAGGPPAGPLDALRALDAADPNRLTDCDVPLALLHWTQNHIELLDGWAVRRLLRFASGAGAVIRVPGWGPERLYQFLDQLRDLFDTLGGLSLLHVRDFFRFVPPVAFFPVSGPGSPRGFHALRFFEPFVTAPTPDEIAVPHLAELLEASFAHPAVDLDAAPVVQLYRVRENVAGVVAGATGQRYLAFTARAMHGPLAHDGVEGTLAGAWEVYRGLVRRRVFLPPPDGEAAINARDTITAAIQDVTALANRLAALAGGRHLDTAGVLEALGEMYRLQDELATLFVSPIPGVFDTQDRELFGETLAGLLDDAIPGGGLALGPAVDAADVHAAVAAQDAINRFVGGWSGEGVAIGPFGFTYMDSPDGLNLVPGDPGPFRHRFALRNGTDKQLTFGLDAQIAAQTGDWDGRAAIRDAAGNVLERTTLASGATRVLTVFVTAPPDAALGETATLVLTATAPPPTDRTAETTLDLLVADEGGPPVLRSVTFEAVQLPPQDLQNAPPQTVLSFLFNLLYAAPDGPPEAGFEVVAEMTATPQDLWMIEFPGVPNGNPAPGLITRMITLSTAASSQVELRMLTPPRGTASRTATFTIRVTSTTLDPMIEAELDTPIDVRVLPA